METMKHVWKDVLRYKAITTAINYQKLTYQKASLLEFDSKNLGLVIHAIDWRFVASIRSEKSHLPFLAGFAAPVTRSRADQFRNEWVPGHAHLLTAVQVHFLNAVLAMGSNVGDLILFIDYKVVYNIVSGFAKTCLISPRNIPAFIPRFATSTGSPAGSSVFGST